MSQPTTYSGDAIADWEDAIVAKMTSRAGTSRADAIKALTREQPKLHQAYIEQYNARHVQRVNAQFGRR